MRENLRAEAFLAGEAPLDVREIEIRHSAWLTKVSFRHNNRIS